MREGITVCLFVEVVVTKYIHLVSHLVARFVILMRRLYVCVNIDIDKNCFHIIKYGNLEKIGIFVPYKKNCFCEVLICQN